MIKFVVLLFMVNCCIGQQIAKKKCEQYAALAKAKKEAPQCHAFTDNKSGVSVEPDEVPATAMLGYVAPSGEVVYLCDATLISEDTLLTTGHCLQQKKYGRPKWVRLGATHSTLGEEFEVKEALCHPQYHPGHDIGLVKLKQKVSYTPACLDTTGVTAGVKGVGVGRPISKSYTELRKKCPLKSTLQVMPVSDCVKSFPFLNITTEAVLCTKDPVGGPGDCMSGPLYVSSESDPCVHTVAGAASFGRPCFDESPNGRKPSVYTRVYNYLPWIEKITWPETSTDASTHS